MSLGGGQFFTDVTHGNASFFDRYGDPRVQDWFLLQGPLPVCVLLATYLYFSTKLGPQIMRNRKPFQLKTHMMIYNFFNVIGCVWLIYELLAAGWWGDYNFTCQPVDYSDSPKALRMARAGWYYFIFKVVELLDTVFFVLRKKDKQITFLHLYHHSIMPITTWATAKFWAGGHSSFAGLINTMIHVVMYSYYFLSALGPQYQKYLWWKKYLTSLQLIQFVLILIHQSQVFFNGCELPKFLPIFFTLNSAYFLYLFGSFYINTYKSKAKKKE